MNAPRCLRAELLPVRVRDLERPPAELYVRGELPRGPAVAIVGTRRASVAGLEFARRLARELASRGVAVLSGGAEGIDTAAHEGALAAAGVTVVVAPSGFSRPFPESNRELFARVVENGGAYVSLVPDDAAATQTAFFPRNACLVALCHALVLVEAPRRSGARNAVAWARKLGRPLFVVPHAPWGEGEGCLAELQRGARLLRGARDVLDLLAAQSLHALAPLVPSSLTVPEEGPPFEPRSPDLASGAGGHRPADLSGPRPAELDGSDAVLSAIQGGARHVDEVAAATGLSVGLVQQRILTLALRGVLVPDPSGLLRLVSI